MSASNASPSPRKDRIFSWFNDWLLGYDVFLAYSRYEVDRQQGYDGQSYTEKLYDRLQANKYRCCVDWKEFHAAELDAITLRRVRYPRHSRGLEKR